MTQSLFVYAIGGLCVVFGAVLILVRERLLMQLTVEQTRLIFGAEEAVEVGVPLSQARQMTVKMRVHYPSLLFLLAGVGAALYAYATDLDRIAGERDDAIARLKLAEEKAAGLERSHTTNTWTIIGEIQRPPGPAPICTEPNCPGQSPVMAVIPSGYNVTVQDGSFNLQVDVPNDQTFEQAVHAIQYRHGCEYFTIYPDESFQDKSKGQPSTLVSEAALMRRYAVAVEIDQQCTRQGGQP